MPPFLLSEIWGKAHKKSDNAKDTIAFIRDIGARCKVRTCDPCRVKAVLYR